MKISIPELSLVVLVGPSGAGKSSFGRKHFLPTEVISSDFCRGLVADDENDQTASTDAFDVLNFIVAKRLAAGRLTVIDATNVTPEARKPLVTLARQHDCLPVAIVLDLPKSICQARNAERPDRQFGGHVLGRQVSQLRRSIRGLKREGFRHVFVLSSPEEIDAATIERVKLWNDRRDDPGPFDLIGDVHGCYGELVTLLGELGYRVEGTREAPKVTPPEGRRALFLGDLVDRGPDSPGVLRLVMHMVAEGTALCIPGNHEIKLEKKLDGRDVKLSHGLKETMEQLAREPEDFPGRVKEFIRGLISHYVLDEGRLVVAHAGLKEQFHGRASGRVRQFCLFGETTGETDEYGLPVRYDWARDYRGRALVVYGHTPVLEADWVNGTLCIDTGCVFGGRLTALRYPEREMVSVPAERVHYEPIKPLEPRESDPEDRPRADLLDVSDVSGDRYIQTRLRGTVSLRGENASAALEVMSRFAVDPHWLIYLPPTMSPPETHEDGPLLEHPEECFGHYRSKSVETVVCEEKHMGSRAIVVVCRDEDVARRRFGATSGELGVITSRTGRAFFDAPRDRQVLERVRAAIEAADWWRQLESDWFLIDAEIMPWSAKAQELLRTQYARVGAAATASLSDAARLLEQCANRIGEGEALLERTLARRDASSAFVEAYRRYCWTVDSIDDLVIAPFHLLAGEGRVFTDQDHLWHMKQLATLAKVDPGFFRATNHRAVSLNDEKEISEAIAWWMELTEAGGEGMVVKPLQWNAKGRRGLLQPAVKCRGREYLRIIYGPDYDRPENLERLRKRGLKRKRSLAMREYALGLEALHRFVDGEPLYRVHECVFGVLAMESEPVDPRL